MSDAEIPTRLELLKNGEHRATGGVRYGHTRVGVILAFDMPANKANEQPIENPPASRLLAMHFSSADEATDESLDWIEAESVVVGDEVTIRVLGSGPVDTPVKRDLPLRKRMLIDPVEFRTQVWEMAAEYDVAVSELLSGLTLPDKDFRQRAYNYYEKLGHYSQALTYAIENSVGSEQKDYVGMKSRISGFGTVLMCQLRNHRQRIGVDPPWTDDDNGTTK